jgi:hypothetical protein
MTSVSIDYLIDYVRVSVGDMNPLLYRYTDDWIETSLVLSIKTLQRYWQDKYVIDSNNMVTRNTNYQYWLFDESLGVIEGGDEPIITLMAAIIMLEGSLENSAWDAVSWRDAEISVSNLQSTSVRSANLKRLIDELFSMITPPTKRLAKAIKYSLPGYLQNYYEVSIGKNKNFTND